MPANNPRIVQFPSHRSSAFSQAKQLPRARRRPWLRMVVLCCSAVYLLWAGSQLVKQEMRMRELRQSYRELVAAHEELQAANERMLSQIESLTNDPAYLEQLARQMGMVKPSDTIYLQAEPNR